MYSIDVCFYAVYLSAAVSILILYETKISEICICNKINIKSIDNLIYEIILFCGQIISLSFNLPQSHLRSGMNLEDLDPDELRCFVSGA